MNRIIGIRTNAENSVKSTVLLFAIFITVAMFLALCSPVRAAENLISNPGFENDAGNGLPVDWYQGGWGTNTAVFSYPVAGYNSPKAAKVEITSYTNGDAKWYFTDVPVTAGELYHFSDMYQSNVMSEITIQYLMDDQSYQYVWLEDIAAAPAWQPYSTSFTVPTGAVSMTLFHILYGVGYLTVDDYSLTADTPPTPTVTITSPSDGDTVSGIISVNANVTDTTGSVQFYLDGSALGAPDNTAPYSVSFDANTVADGTHSLGATLTYGTGQTVSATSISVTVDNYVPPTPTITITEPLDGATVSGTVNVSADVTDAIGSVQFYLDGSVLGASDDTAPYSVSFDTNTVADGAHSLGATLTYGAGQTVTATSVSVTVDNYVPPTPTVTITSPLEGDTISGVINVNADVTDTTGSVQFYLDGSALGAPDDTAPYSVSFDTNTVSDGNHSLGATLTYGTGQTVTATSVSVTVDNYVPPTPTITITEPLDGATVSGTVNVSADVTDATGSVQFYLDGSALGAPDNTAPYSVSFDTTVVVNGTHAIDATLFYGSGQSVNATSVAVTVDNATTTPVNLVSNPGFEETGAGGMPVGWSSNSWGTNVSSFTYPVAGHTGTKAARVDISSYSNGDAKWYFDDIPVTPGQTYTLSDYYVSDVMSEITLRYTMNNASYQYVGLSTVMPSTGWQEHKLCFTAPANTVSVTAFHLIYSVGSLIVDDYSLVEGCASSFDEGMITLSFDDASYSQYENAFPVMQANNLTGTFYVETADALDPQESWAFHTAEILEMQAAGYEMGAHSRNHPHLPDLTIAEMQTEILGSRTDLLGIGATPVNTFAYPYGEYNQAAVQVVKDAGYTSARGVDAGFNNKDTDKYALLVMQVGSNIGPAQVQAWVDQAIQDKTWLILMFHEVINAGDEYSTTPADFQAMAQLIDSSGIKDVTVSEGISYMNP